MKLSFVWMHSPEELRELATPWESSGPTWQDAGTSPCPTVRFTTLVNLLLKSCNECIGECIHGRSRSGPLGDEKVCRFVENFVHISMSIFCEGTKKAIVQRKSPELDESNGTVVIDKV